MKLLVVLAVLGLALTAVQARPAKQEKAFLRLLDALRRRPGHGSGDGSGDGDGRRPRPSGPPPSGPPPSGPPPTGPPPSGPPPSEEPSTDLELEQVMLKMFKSLKTDSERRRPGKGDGPEGDGPRPGGPRPGGSGHGGDSHFDSFEVNGDYGDYDYDGGDYEDHGMGKKMTCMHMIEETVAPKVHDVIVNRESELFDTLNTLGAPDSLLEYLVTGNSSVVENIIEEICPVLSEMEPDFSMRSQKSMVLHGRSMRSLDDMNLPPIHEIVANNTIAFAALATAGDLSTCAASLTDRLILYRVMAEAPRSLCMMPPSDMLGVIMCTDAIIVDEIKDLENPLNSLCEFMLMMA